MSATPGRRPSPDLDDAARLAWLRLYRSENVGPRTFAQLLRRFGSAEAALDALPDLAARGGRRIAVCPASTAAAELDRLSRLGARIVRRPDDAYPPILHHDDNAPPILAVMGEPAIFARPAIAIVGARNASASGVKLTGSLAEALGEAGYATVSGLARGIDAAAHRATLASGTIGVFAGGLDKPYPDENRPLMRAIVDAGGALVSERPLGLAPKARDFPRRNRLVVALATGVLVVEAAQRSGSLISARLAGELNRTLFAVPGSPLDPRAAGTNRLIKDGAILTTEARDVVETLRPLDDRARSTGPAALHEPLDTPFEPASEAADDDRRRILEALAPTPMPVDDIIEHAGVAPGAAQMALLELDLAGRLERHPGGAVSLLP